MVRRLLDAVDVVLEGGVTPGVVLLLLDEKKQQHDNKRWGRMHMGKKKSQANTFGQKGDKR